jgi:hypothetical protein
MRFELKAAALLAAITMLAGCAGMAFKDASETNTIAAYEKFLAKHGDSEMGPEAKRRIDQLYFDKAEAAGTIAAFETYVKQRRNSALVPEAKRRIDALHFKNAETTGTIEAYESYLRSQRDGALVPEAKRRTDELYFKRAETEGTIAAYQAYVAKRGDSAQVPEAKRRIEQLSDDQDWAAAGKAESVDLYRQFLERHPASSRAEVAKTRMGLLEEYRVGWEAVQRKPTVAGLRNYQKQHPESPYREKAAEIAQDIEGRNIVDLLEAGRIEVDASGDGIENLTIRVRKTAPYPVTVLVPVGTYFVSLRDKVQDMVVVAESKLAVSADGWKNASLAVACANKPKDIPDTNDKFKVARAPKLEDLARLMSSIKNVNANFGTRQAAVWIVTDDVSFKELGVLVTQFETPPYGSDRLIKAPEAAWAMKMCADAGIDISAKRIWRDRAEIMKGLPAGALKKWLTGKN